MINYARKEMYFNVKNRTGYKQKFTRETSDILYMQDRLKLGIKMFHLLLAKYQIRR